MVSFQDEKTNVNVRGDTLLFLLESNSTLVKRINQVLVLVTLQTKLSLLLILYNMVAINKKKSKKEKDDLPRSMRPLIPEPKHR